MGARLALPTLTPGHLRLLRRQAVPIPYRLALAGQRLIRRLDCGRDAQLRSVRKRDRQELAAMGPVAERCMITEMFMPGVRVLGTSPAAPDRRVRHLDRPLVELTIAVGHHQGDPSVRIGPLEFLTWPATVVCLLASNMAKE